jgi:predicted enzyme related to lactoylglutathione lyase
MSSVGAGGHYVVSVIREGHVSTTIQPIIATADLDRLLDFYTSVLGAVESTRVPDEGPTFFVGLTVGEADLGLVVNAEVDTGARQRIVLSVGVDSVDDLLSRVEPAGGRVLGPPNDMPWGQRVAHIQDPDGNPVNLTQPT